MKIGTSGALLSNLLWTANCLSLAVDPTVGADDEACEMQKTLLQTTAEVRVTKRHHIPKQQEVEKPFEASPRFEVRPQARELLLAAVSQTKAKLANQPAVQHSEAVRRSRQEECAIADETDENLEVASLVPNNELVCYQGTKRELDQVYCFLQTAPTRALYRAGASPWHQGEVPDDVEVQLGSCGERGFDFLMHDPDDCWAPVQKWLNEENREADMEAWENAQAQNWDNYDSYFETEFLDMGIFLSGCICLPGSDVIHALDELCDAVQAENLLPIAS